MGIWALTLREEHRPFVFENSVLKKILGSKRDEVGLKGDGEHYITRSFLIFISHHIFGGLITKDQMDVAWGTYRGRTEIYI